MSFMFLVLLKMIIYFIRDQRDNYFFPINSVMCNSDIINVLRGFS